MEKELRLWADHRRFDLNVVLLWAAAGWHRGFVPKEEITAGDLLEACRAERRWTKKLGLCYKLEEALGESMGAWR